jgi:hypothetical protein
MSAGRALLERLGVVVPTGFVATTIGLALIAGAIIVLGVCFTVVAAALRGLRLLATAMVFGAIGWAVSAYVVPSVLVLTSGPVLGTAQRVFVSVTLVMALVAGMRLARPGPHTE